MDTQHETPLTRRVLRGGVIVLIFSFLASPLGYAFRLLLSRTLSIEMFGLFYAVLALFTIIITYNDLGFGLSAAYFIPKFLAKGDKQSVWNIHIYDRTIEMAISIVLSTLLFFSAKWLAVFYFKNAAAEQLIYIFCIYFIANSFLSSIQKLFLGLQKEHIYASILTSSFLFTIVFASFFWITNISRVLFFASAWSFAYLATSIIYAFVLYKKNARIIMPTTWDKPLFRMMLVYALPTLFTASVYTLIVSTDVFFLTLFKGVREVGIYNVVMPIAAISGIFLLPLNSFFFPLVSHLDERGEKRQLQHLMKSILQLIPLIAVYFGLFIFLLPDATIGVLFGNQWIRLASIPLMFAVVTSVFSALSSYFTIVAAGIGLVRQRLEIASILAIGNIALSSFLIYHYSVLGALVAGTIIQFVAILLFGKIISKNIAFQYPVGFYVKLMLFSVSIIGFKSLLQLQSSTLISYIFLGFIYTVCVSVFVFMTKPFSPQTLEVLTSVLKGKRTLLKFFSHASDSPLQ